MTGYACKECESPASVSSDGAIRRSCSHLGTVVASMKATAYGIASLRVKAARTPREKFVDLLSSILRKVGMK